MKKLLLAVVLLCFASVARADTIADVRWLADRPDGTHVVLDTKWVASLPFNFGLSSFACPSSCALMVTLTFSGFDGQLLNLAAFFNGAPTFAFHNLLIADGPFLLVQGNSEGVRYSVSAVGSTATVVPEPAGLALVGALLVAWRARKR